ncbi:hypothetical protein ACFLVN_02655 [Chloroflexota bacterium]
MPTINNIVDSMRSKSRKPGEIELRGLPDRKALIHGRLSGFSQVKDSKESVREIAAQVGKAIEDGYRTSLDPDMIEAWLRRIQAGEEPPGVMEEGEVIVNCLGLGVSGTLSEDKRPDLQLTMNYLRKSGLGAIYVTEGANRLSRDPDRVVSATLLKQMKDTNCKLRTPYEVLSPCVERDWEVIHEELERGADELKGMNKRLCRRRALKAARGEFVGEPILPGFIVPIVEIRSNGSRVYGNYQRYAPHAEITERILREFIRQGFSEMKAHRALDGLSYPLFPPDLQYMEKLSSLRRTKKVEGVGYLISPSMVSSLATNPKLVGWAVWGDAEPIAHNHEAMVPENLWLEACQGTMEAIKRRGRGIRHEPQEWDSILRCCNHDIPQRISGHASKGSYRCQHDYVQGLSPSSCFDIAAHHLDKPLTEAVLEKLDFTPFAEELLMQMERDAANTTLEEDRQMKEIAQLERRIENLEEQLGWEGGTHDQLLLTQIEKSQTKLGELKSRPLPNHPLPVTSYKAVKEFLVGLSGNWTTYSRTLRNQLLKRLVDHVDVRHNGQTFEATIVWKTGQTQVVSIQRARAKGNSESHWSVEELAVLKKLWPATSQDKIMTALPQRTWKAIAHQAYNLGLKRAHTSPERSQRRRWQADEDHKSRQLYEEGIPVLDIASKQGRTCSAVLQRAWEKGWRRPDQAQELALIDSREVNQNPEVSKRISSGTTTGGRSDALFVQSCFYWHQSLIYRRAP